MEVHLPRTNAHLPILLPIVVPLALILIGEMLLLANDLEASIVVHLLNVLVCVTAPVLLKENPLLWQSFSLLSMLRILNLGIPKFTTALYWIPLVYAPMIIVAFLVVDNGSLGWRDRAKDLKKRLTNSSRASGWKYHYFPLGLIVALLLANIEFRVLSPIIPNLRMVPDLGLWNLALLFLVMVFLVALGEELVFRYILQTRLEGVVGAVGAITISSIAFAVMHIGYQSLLYIAYVFLAALLLGSLYSRTKSLALVVLIHGMLDFFLFSLLPFGYLVL